MSLPERKYIDGRGWKYQVMNGIGGDTYKARFQRREKHGDEGWRGLGAVPWRDTRDEAQADLDALAAKNGWKEWGGAGG